MTDLRALLIQILAPRAVDPSSSSARYFSRADEDEATARWAHANHLADRILDLFENRVPTQGSSSFADGDVETTVIQLKSDDLTEIARFVHNKQCNGWKLKCVAPNRTYIFTK